MDMKDNDIDFVVGPIEITRMPFLITRQLTNLSF